MSRPLQEGDRLVLIFDGGRPWRIELDDDSLGRPFKWIVDEVSYCGNLFDTFERAHAYIQTWKLKGLHAELYQLTRDRDAKHDIYTYSSSDTRDSLPRFFSTGWDSTFYAWYRLAERRDIHVAR